MSRVNFHEKIRSELLRGNRQVQADVEWEWLTGLPAVDPKRVTFLLDGCQFFYAHYSFSGSSAQPAFVMAFGDRHPCIADEHNTEYLQLLINRMQDLTGFQCVVVIGGDVRLVCLYDAARQKWNAIPGVFA